MAPSMSGGVGVRDHDTRGKKPASLLSMRKNTVSSRLDDGDVRPSDSASNAPAPASAPMSSTRPPKVTNDHARSYDLHSTDQYNVPSTDPYDAPPSDKMAATAHNRRPAHPLSPFHGHGGKESPRDAIAKAQRRSRLASTEHDEPMQSPKQTEKQTSPIWKPQASLNAPTTAPLASRLHAPPLASTVADSLHPPPFRDLSLVEQESAIVEDLLFVFMGFEGQYVRFNSSYRPEDEKHRLKGPAFRIAKGLDISLLGLSTTLLDLGTHYIAVEAFADVHSRQDYGLVNHALCAAIRQHLRDYLVLITQIEAEFLTNPNFTLHLLNLHLLPTAHNMLQLYLLVQEILRRNKTIEEDDSDEDADIDEIIEQLKEGAELGFGSGQKLLKGGQILRLLTDRLSHMSGDPAAKTLLDGLLREASRPYVAMLNTWLHRGSIRDPHHEFLVREQRSINRERLHEDFTDEYWDKRYTIRASEVPPQLEAYKDKVLLAGKYLNVVRECGGVDVSKVIRDVPSTFDDPSLIQNIHDAYAYANESLLNLLLTTHALPARLRSLKHYFFLDRSDFFSYFLYLSNSELKKQVKDVNVSKLQSLLDLVLRQPGSVAAEDPFKEDVKIHLNDQSLTKFLVSVVNIRGMEDGAEESLPHRTPAANTSNDDGERMSGFDALELRYSIPFPLSLVISSRTVVRYQILFRYLLSMRHVENLLIKCWEDHVKLVGWVHRSGDHGLELWKRRAWMLRGRMLNFVQQFTYYCTAEVIEPNWNALMAKVMGTSVSNASSSRTVDELIEDHVDFLDTCLKECLLTNSKLLKIHNKIITCCTLFAAYTSTFSRSLCAADPTLAGTPAARQYLQTIYPSARHPIPDQLLSFDAHAQPKLQDSLAKYEENFNRHVRILLDALDYYAATETVALGRLCAQLSLASEKNADDRSL